MSTRLLLGVGALLLAIVAVYLPALAGPFQFDDYRVIVDNPQVHGLAAWWSSMPGIRPLLKLSYALNWVLTPRPFGFHAFNLAVHAINALLVCAVATQWLRALAPRVTLPAAGALLIALLFSLHPSTTEAVTYVSGRSVSLMSLFYLGAIWLHSQAWRHAALLSALAFAFALGVRETAITLPIALWLIAWFRGEKAGESLRNLRWHGLVLVVAVLVAWWWPGYDRFFRHSLETRDAGAQLLGQLEAHAYLFRHSLVGLQTNLDPDLAIPSTWDANTILTALLLTAALALSVASRRRWPWLGFGIAWYLLQLAPSNSLMPRFDLANDRHLYLALPGAALVLAVPLLSLGRRWVGCIALTLVALVLAQATWYRNQDYRDETTLWRATVTDSPGKARAWSNLGWARQLQQDWVGARHAYECALAIQPDHQQSLVNLSLLPAVATADGQPDCSGRFSERPD